MDELVLEAMLVGGDVGELSRNFSWTVCLESLLFRAHETNNPDCIKSPEAFHVSGGNRASRARHGAEVFPTKGTDAGRVAVAQATSTGSKTTARRRALFVPSS